MKFVTLIPGLVIGATEIAVLWTHMHTFVYPRDTLVMNVFDVNRVLGLLHRVDVVDVTNV